MKTTNCFVLLFLIASLACAQPALRIGFAGQSPSSGEMGLATGWDANVAFTIPVKEPGSLLVIAGGQLYPTSEGQEFRIARAIYAGLGVEGKWMFLGAWTKVDVFVNLYGGDRYLSFNGKSQHAFLFGARAGFAEHDFWRVYAEVQHSTYKYDAQVRYLTFGVGLSARVL